MSVHKDTATSTNNGPTNKGLYWFIFTVSVLLGVAFLSMRAVTIRLDEMSAVSHVASRSSDGEPYGLDFCALLSFVGAAIALYRARPSK